MIDYSNLKNYLTIIVLANVVSAFPMAFFVKKDFARIGRVSWRVAIWTGITMHGHAIVTFGMAWIDRESFYTANIWILLLGIFILVGGTYLIYLGRKAYGDRERVYGLRENKLIKNGIYKYSRNPQYLGYALMLTGASIASGSSVTYCFTVIFIALTHVYITKIEEPHLANRFGEDYKLFCKSSARYFSITSPK